jgi:hypothetical protein
MLQPGGDFDFPEEPLAAERGGDLRESMRIIGAKFKSYWEILEQKKKSFATETELLNL